MMVLSRMVRTVVLAGGGAAMVLMAGCDVELGESTRGELGRVDFSYTSGCLFGCSLERPLLPGTTARISVSDAGDGQGLSARTSDRTVASASIERSCACVQRGDEWAAGTSVEPEQPCDPGFERQCDNAIVLAAHGAGDAELALFGPDGSVIDRVGVAVRHPRSGWFENGGVPIAPAAVMALAEGESEGLRLHLDDGAGRPLLITGNVTWTISDAEVAGFPRWIGEPVPEVVTDDVVSIQARTAGAAVLSIRAGDFGLEVPLRVTD